MKDNTIGWIFFLLLGSLVITNVYFYSVGKYAGMEKTFYQKNYACKAELVVK